MTKPNEPEIDLIIAVHTPSRPIERAVGSVLDHTKAAIRVTVVVHNTDPDPIRARLGQYLDDPRLRFAHVVDGIRSPAGPMNHGYDLVTAPYAALLGSDDLADPGAFDAWLAAIAAHDQPIDVLVAPIRDTRGGLQPSPPIRASRGLDGATLLDPVRDRLFYRSGNIGLISRDALGDLRFTEGLQTGEDQPFSAAIWSRPGLRVIYPVSAPGYREGDDQQDRVTFAWRPVPEEFRTLDFVLAPGSPWLATTDMRRSYLLKLVRVHLFDSARARVGNRWERTDAEQLAAVAQRIVDVDPGFVRLLSRADQRLLEAVLDPGTAEDELARLVRERSRLRSLGAMLPRRWRYSLHGQAPLRFHLAGALMLRRARRRGNGS